MVCRQSRAVRRATVSVDVFEICPSRVCVHFVGLRLLSQRFFDRASTSRRRDGFRLVCYHSILRRLSDATGCHQQPYFSRVRSTGFEWSSDRAEDCRFLSSQWWCPGPLFGIVAIAGEVGQEDYFANLPSSATFHRNLTAEQYERLTDYIESERAKPQIFSLVFNNCNDFVAGAAHAIGLKAPILRMLPPPLFVMLLAQLNS
jgi:hypothetical protein